MKLAGITLCVVLSSMLIKSKNREISNLIAASGICIVLLNAVLLCKDILRKIKEILNEIPDVDGYISIMVKALLIILSAQIISDICRDNGEGALASATEIAAKATVIIVVFPLFETVLSIVNGLIK